MVLLCLAFTGTTWEIIESNEDDPDLYNRVEYGLLKVCQSSKTKKSCSDIDPVSDELTAARVFMILAILFVVLHMFYTFVIYGRKYCCNSDEKEFSSKISITILLFNSLSCLIAVVVKSLDNVNEVVFFGLSKNIGFSFGLTIFTCVFSLSATLVCSGLEQKY